MTNRLRGAAAAAACALTLVLSACGSSGPTADEHGMTAEEHAQWEAEQAAGGGAAVDSEAAPEGGHSGHGGAAAPSGGGGHSGHGGATGETELWAVQSAPLGYVVTDGSGQIVYRSDRDSNQPPTSTCVDPTCTAAWSPLLVGERGVVGLGVNDEDIGVLVRPDGSKQVTVAGWPAYTHVGESTGLESAGGNGAEGVWWAINPQGEKALPPKG
jgi:predicted lipoprotein with Yx(FWY)xxD motif